MWYVPQLVSKLCPVCIQWLRSIFHQCSCGTAPDKHMDNAARAGFPWIPPQSSCEPELTDDRSGLKTKQLLLPLAHMLCARGSWQLPGSQEKIPLCKACLDA